MLFLLRFQGVYRSPRREVANPTRGGGGGSRCNGWSRSWMIPAGTSTVQLSVLTARPCALLAVRPGVQRKNRSCAPVQARAHTHTHLFGCSGLPHDTGHEPPCSECSARAETKDEHRRYTETKARFCTVPILCATQALSSHRVEVRTCLAQKRLLQARTTHHASRETRQKALTEPAGWRDISKARHPNPHKAFKAKPAPSRCPAFGILPSHG